MRINVVIKVKKLASKTLLLLGPPVKLCKERKRKERARKKKKKKKKKKKNKRKERRLM